VEGTAVEGTAAAESAPPRRSRRWPIIAAIAAVFLLIIIYVVAGAAISAGSVARADDALKTTVNHNNALADMFNNDPFKNVDFSSNNPDITGAKNAVATYKKQIATWQADVSADRASLQKARDNLNTSFLTLPEQSTIQSHIRRLDAGISAMKTAQQGIDILQRQSNFMDPLMDVIGGFIAVGKAGDANDLGAMQTQLSATDTAMAKTMAAAAGANLPPQLTAALNSLQKTVTDLKALVAAAQARDAAKVDHYLTLLDADGKALDAIDSNAIDNGETQLLKPLSDSYNRDMKVASGS
jgi:hypothetical protein